MPSLSINNKIKSQVSPDKKERDWTKPLQDGEQPPTLQECEAHIKKCEASGFMNSEEFNYKLDKWLHENL